MTLEMHTAKLLGWLAIRRSRPQLFSYAKLKDDASWQLDFLPGSWAVLLCGQEAERRQGTTCPGSVSPALGLCHLLWVCVTAWKHALRTLAEHLLPDLGSKSPHRARRSAACAPLQALFHLLAVSYFSDGMVLSCLLFFKAFCEPSS